MSARDARGIVVLGMVTKMPVPGVIWQTLHYLVGLRRLGYDVTYVEAHARTPSTFSREEGDPGSRAAAAFLRDLLSRFGFADRWAFHALHDDGACYGLGRERLERAYRSAEMLINLHGGTRPLPEHAATGRLVFLGTDPCQLEVELWHGRRKTYDFLDAHRAWFTFGENYGAPDCGLPVSDDFELTPTRQPVVLDFWEGDVPDNGLYTTVGNWRQPDRTIRYRGEVYHWSKHLEFLKFLDLPARSGLDFELTLSSLGPQGRERLERNGWRVRDAVELSADPEAYRDHIRRSRGEFTVAKDQNVRLRSGWFSDRSATYLAAGRPVVTQETGFSSLLPTGGGLFGFTTTDEAVAALETIEADYPAACREARRVARECFDYRVVLSRLLTDAGVEGPRRPHPVGGVEGGRDPFPEDLVLEPVSRRPLQLPDETLRTLVGRPLPAVGERVDGSGVGAAASVIVVTFDNLALTRLCLESLLTHTRHPRYEVVVVDNGSTDGTPPYLRGLASRDARVRLILNPSNEGFARACNQGARAAVGDLLVFLNNDTVLAPGWLERLARHLEDPGVGAVNPVTNRIGTEAEVGGGARDYGGFLELAARRAREREGERRAVEMLAFFCLALQRSVWEEVGELDEAYGQGLFEDDDYSVRLVRAGYRLWCAEDVLVHHFGEAAFGALVPDGRYGRLFERNRRRFEAKWGRTWVRRKAAPDGEYRSLVARVRADAGKALPGGVTVVVVSRGDDELLDLPGQTAWHFPRQDDGGWAGHYPADGEEAVAQLEGQRRRGAGYLLLPRPAFWWLEHYRELRGHLELHGEEVMRTDDLRLYRLREPRFAAVPAGRGEP